MLQTAPTTWGICCDQGSAHQSRWGSMESILGFVYIVMHSSSLHAQMYTWSYRTLLNKPHFYILQQQILSAWRSSQAIRNVYLWFWLVCSHGVSKWRNCFLLAGTEMKILIMNLTCSCFVFDICIYPCWYIQDNLVLESHLEELGRCRVWHGAELRSLPSKLKFSFSINFNFSYHIFIKTVTTKAVL